MSEGKEHLSIVICGHVDSGKSTTTVVVVELGGIPEREVEKLKAEADALGKSSFAFAFYGSPKGRTRTWCDHFVHDQGVFSRTSGTTPSSTRRDTEILSRT